MINVIKLPSFTDPYSDLEDYQKALPGYYLSLEGHLYLRLAGSLSNLCWFGVSSRKMYSHEQMAANKIRLASRLLDALTTAGVVREVAGEGNSEASHSMMTQILRAIPQRGDGVLETQEEGEKDEQEAEASNE